MAAASTFLWSSYCLNVMYVPFTFCFIFPSLLHFPLCLSAPSSVIHFLWNVMWIYHWERRTSPSHRLCCLWALSGRDPSPRNRKRWCDWSLIKTCICSWWGDLWTEGLAARLYLTPLFTVKYTVMTDIRIMLSGAWWCFTGLCTSTQS